MVIIKLLLKIVLWWGVYKTPVSDRAAGGFVDVDGRTHLKKHWSAIFSVFPMGAFGPG